DQARLSAQAIKEQVLSRRMPPWNAVEGFGEFKDDRSLSQEEIEIFAEWVEGGAPEGNPAYLPALPESCYEMLRRTLFPREPVLILKKMVSAEGIEPSTY